MILIMPKVNVTLGMVTFTESEGDKGNESVKGNRPDHDGRMSQGLVRLSDRGRRHRAHVVVRGHG